MGNRKLPFGYAMEFGEVVINPKEANWVQEIFRLYQEGESFRSITNRIRETGVEYEAGKLWNKNMVARILENAKYIGADNYPAIITNEQFTAVTIRRKGRQGKIKITEARKALRRICVVKVTDTIERQILTILNYLIQNPEVVTAEASSSSELRMSQLQRELDAVMIQQPMNEGQARMLILKLAAAKYEAISSSAYETERIQRILRKSKPAKELDPALLQACVAKVSVSEGVVNINLKNGQVIKRSAVS